ncbi:hypothetical protein EYF80_001198 [Liparis tanakae]|uniref:Uncharacterized protein n=1 Tax=Liparis tanakae TaxID=230148 RepID=A0A4Z2JDU0_9TELE|nr:hypothetical protein EYF80_001198 [Liparis tanakae]
MLTPPCLRPLRGDPEDQQDQEAQQDLGCHHGQQDQWDLSLPEHITVVIRSVTLSARRSLGAVASCQTDGPSGASGASLSRRTLSPKNKDPSVTAAACGSGLENDIRHPALLSHPQWPFTGRVLNAWRAKLCTARDDVTIVTGYLRMGRRDPEALLLPLSQLDPESRGQERSQVDLAHRVDPESLDVLAPRWVPSLRVTGQPILSCWTLGRCSYGKLKGELVLDEPDSRHGDKTPLKLLQTASRINRGAKLLTESDGVQQPKPQPAEGLMHRLMERDNGCKQTRTVTLSPLEDDGTFV